MSEELCARCWDLAGWHIVATMNGPRPYRGPDILPYPCAKEGCDCPAFVPPKEEGA